jgi:hypothetical protein
MNRELRGSIIDHDVPSDEEKFGCPMLVRNHGDAPRGVRQSGFRCSLGWALHDKRDVERCGEVESVPACWKSQPERLMSLSPARGSSSNGHTPPVENA